MLAAFVCLVSICKPTALRAESLSNRLSSLAPKLSRDVLQMALHATECAVASGAAQDANYLGVVDYSLPSTKKRFWVFDLKHPQLLWEELIAHGKNSGDNYATAFSNKVGSLQSSLGLFRTGDTYVGRNGYSMHLHGLEPGINNAALDRAIVMHGASYVSKDFVQHYGRLGRSWGCPALRQEVSTDVINTLKDDAFLFVYYPDSEWKQESPYLKNCG
ncbi:MAG: murein L,D-transpeptidase catalytic domain family protein [Deltaproteobacteria bacterium]|nr:murein L,D-transpeptidase catalytic domain family protein [Deltaproteobacteria bacterium]